MKKKNLMFGIIFIAAFLIVIPINAFSSTFMPDFTQTLSNVRFWALDDPISNDDDTVTFSNVLFSTEFEANVQYSLTPTVDNSWNEFTGGTTITPVDNEKQLVYLRVNDTSELYYNGILTFSGFDRHYYGLDAYNSLSVLWGDVGTLTVSFTTPVGDDDVAPVPIPATVWLFGAGLVGLVGIRRKLRS
jgi:hypothetical protein